MEKTLTEAPAKDYRVVKHRIPDELVYERINGKPVYYKGYQDVIKQNKQIEEVMGSSLLQSLIVQYLLRFMFVILDKNKFDILTNELGIHLSNKNNISADIAIYEKSKLYTSKIEDKYVTIPPKLIIEIDTKADLNDFDNVMDYYTVKTNKLFEFGVEKVLWILTTNRHIIDATPNSPWFIKKWNDEIELFDNHSFNLENLLKDEGVWDLLIIDEQK